MLNERSDKLNAKAQKITIKLPWEILTIYSEVLPEDDEEDEDDIEAHEASVLRLKVSIDEVSCHMQETEFHAGSRRCYEADDKRRISTLLGLSASIVHIS